ncbi:DUF2852 domain-containing protein [Hyphomicrobium sp.]|uniref:DUF2852 domain-containing protein n=1 Tax=Hyphomicrobium sp. TaxID=82 RepID=UPI001DE0CBDA|nr:DUF2852 domain-containing protein [Hyphomicrobium sp.]MBY0559672.1 DUF2852 domain-containing protein [Hyphomicrobium sp.]
MFHHFFHPLAFFMHAVGIALVVVAVVMFLMARRGFAGHRCGRGRETYPRRDTDNSAFEDYRRATLTRLEKEAEEFRSYLDGLRRAADASAFQAFLRARKSGESSAS